jgi:hypothetical protein
MEDFTIGSTQTDIDEIPDFLQDKSSMTTNTSIPMAMDEEGEEKESNTEGDNDGNKSLNKLIHGHSTYEIYQSFWNLQSYFNTDIKKADIMFGLAITPQITKVSTDVSGTVEGDDDDKNHKSDWKGFIKHIELVLDLFTSKPFSTSEKDQAKDHIRKSLAMCLSQHKANRKRWISHLQSSIYY